MFFKKCPEPRHFSAWQHADPSHYHSSPGLRQQPPNPVSLLLSHFLWPVLNRAARVILLNVSQIMSPPRVPLLGRKVFTMAWWPHLLSPLLLTILLALWSSSTPFLVQLALATPASLLFLQRAKHTPAPGPLHVLFPFSGILSS